MTAVGVPPDAGTFDNGLRLPRTKDNQSVTVPGTAATSADRIT